MYVLGVVLFEGNVALARKILLSKQNHLIKFRVLLYSQGTQLE